MAAADDVRRTQRKNSHGVWTLQHWLACAAQRKQNLCASLFLRTFGAAECFRRDCLLHPARGWCAWTGSRQLLRVSQLSVSMLVQRCRSGAFESTLSWSHHISSRDRSLRAEIRILVMFWLREASNFVPRRNHYSIIIRKVKNEGRGSFGPSSGGKCTQCTA